MIGETMMLAGAAMMMMQHRHELSLDPVPGAMLRDAFAAGVDAPIPADMRVLTRRIAGPLRIVKGKGQ